MVDEDALNIYTDGSSLSKPRRGGTGIRIIYIDASGNEVVHDFSEPGSKGANSIEMEMDACIQSLHQAIPFLKKFSFRKIIIYTDSQFIIDNVRNAIFIWPNTKWRKRDGGPVINAALWKELVKGIKKTNVFIEFRKVKGHSTNEHNNVVDRLAKKSAKTPQNPIQPGTIVRRKFSSERTQIGSVGFLGQRVRIRIIESKYLPVQKTTRYRFEVVSKSSKYYKKVDFLYSNENLRPAHVFSVRLNIDSGNPGIQNIFGEVRPKENAKE